jgi:hypothetical protein
MKTNINLRTYLAKFFLEWENFRTKFVEKIKTHIFCSIYFFFENRAMYEIMWKDVVQPERPQTAVWRMRIACSIPKATNTYSEHVKLIASALQRWLHEHSLMLSYMYTAWLVGLSNEIVGNSDYLAIID